MQVTNAALYHIMSKLREKFNLKPPIPKTENNQRRMFPFWLNIASRKLEKALIFDSNINIIFESIEKQRDIEKSKKNLIKYWLPRSFPKRVNCIVTTLRGTEADRYFRKENGVNCHRIKIKLNCGVKSGEFKSLGGMAGVIFDDAFNKKCFNEFNERVVEIWRDELVGFGYAEDEDGRRVGGKDYQFTKMYFDLFLQRADESKIKCK